MNSSLIQTAAALLLALSGALPVQGASPAGQPVPLDKLPPASAAPAIQNAQSSAPATSVLERFRTYTGARSPAALSGLFSAPVSSRVRQQPEIALSSGAVSISIAAVMTQVNSTAPNFAFNGARLISYAQTKPDEWLIEALPETGVWKAEMIVLTDSAVQEVPLVVAPPLPAETDLSEKGFITFLGGREPAAKPLHDLNGDGRRDYLDEYIFTANYLVRKNSGAPEPSNESPAAPDGQMENPGNGQQRSAAGTSPAPQGPDPARDTAAQSAGGQAGNPAPAGGARTDRSIDRRTYNSLTYGQRKKLREELARKNRLNSPPQGQQPGVQPD